MSFLLFFTTTFRGIASCRALAFSLRRPANGVCRSLRRFSAAPGHPEELRSSSSEQEERLRDAVLAELSSLGAQRDTLTLSGLQARLRDLANLKVVAGSPHLSAPPSSSAFSTAAATVATAVASSPDVEKLTVAELKTELRARGLGVGGLKADLQDRLRRGAGGTPEEGAAAAAAARGLALVKEMAEGGEKEGEGGMEEWLARDLQLQVELEDVVGRHGAAGPQTGVFTDGSSSPNPGPGGWGVVAVQRGRVLWRSRGRSTHTTNNRMEYAAVIEALSRLPADEPGWAVFSDSQLVVRTLEEWAAGWARNGWTKKSSGDIMNLDLVQEAYALRTARPLVALRWIKAHDGSTWNEYADVLANSARRSLL